MRLLTIFIGFTIANFLWALFADRDFKRAIEISFFQGNVLVYLWLFPGK